MATISEPEEKSWVGTSMDDIYHGHGPWGFEVPLVSASRYHAVLYQLPATHRSPPKPHISAQVHHWDDDHVRMPFSEKNVFTVKDKNDQTIVKQRWEFIQECLLQPINSSKELETVLNSYNKRLSKLLALHHFFEEILEEEETEQFFETLLPGIIRLALRLPEILPGSLPLLKQGACRSISLSQLQIASLLANAFLCTFPYTKESPGLCPGVNFVRLFTAHLRPKREQAVAEKLKCICNYFRRVLRTAPVGVVTFERKHFPKSQLPRWDRTDNNLGNTRIHVSTTGVIEEGLGLLQVDFANKNVGGGILGFGCVQEEIRFVLCPELIVSRLFTEQLGPCEALVITGAERYSKYTGYGDTFLWDGDYQDQTPYDSSGRRRTSIVAIDALRFPKPAEQYNPSCMLRELNKAYVGFHSRFDGHLPAVATGNWGCGAFRGDARLKSLVQLMACSAAKRDMVYFTFGDDNLRDSIHEMYLFLATNQITIAQLWRYLCRFCAANLKPEHLFAYIQQAHFDSKSQLSIKNFFCFNKKKVEKDRSRPSTSNINHSPAKSRESDVVDGVSNKNNLSTGYPEEEVIYGSDIENEPDIIESSQPEEIIKRPLPQELKQFKENSDNSRSNLKKKKEHNVDDGLDIADLFDIKPRKQEKDDNMSLLATLDKLFQNAEDGEIQEKVSDRLCEKMEVDDIIDTSMDNMKATSSYVVEDDSTPKRKITDYFIKMDKG